MIDKGIELGNNIVQKCTKSIDENKKLNQIGANSWQKEHLGLYY